MAIGPRAIGPRCCAQVVQLEMVIGFAWVDSALVLSVKWCRTARPCFPIAGGQRPAEEVSGESRGPLAPGYFVNVQQEEDHANHAATARPQRS